MADAPTFENRSPASRVSAVLAERAEGPREPSDDRSLQLAREDPAHLEAVDFFGDQAPGRLSRHHLLRPRSCRPVRKTLASLLPSARRTRLFLIGSISQTGSPAWRSAARSAGGRQTAPRSTTTPSAIM